MASKKEYLDYILDQLSPLGEVTFRRMMGEYILYYQGKIIGGIYDDRFLVKRTRAAERLMPDAAPQTPYPGAKEMLLVDNVDDPAFLKRLLRAMADEPPDGRGAR